MNHFANAQLAQNRILGAMPEMERAQLSTHLEQVPLRAGDTLYEMGGRIEKVYFPSDGIVSHICNTEDGFSAALAMTGRDGLIGSVLALGDEWSQHQLVVQNDGHAFVLRTPHFLRALERDASLRPLCLGYTRQLMVQMAQGSVCNRHHRVRQQLGRWLLQSLDILGGDRVDLTQEMIGHVLGVRREAVNEAARFLQGHGVIDYSRGRIRLLDRPGLEAQTCECYWVVKNHHVESSTAGESSTADRPVDHKGSRYGYGLGGGNGHLPMESLGRRADRLHDPAFGRHSAGTSGSSSTAGTAGTAGTADTGRFSSAPTRPSPAELRNPQVRSRPLPALTLPEVHPPTSRQERISAGWAQLTDESVQSVLGEEEDVRSMRGGLHAQGEGFQTMRESRNAQGDGSQVMHRGMNALEEQKEVVRSLHGWPLPARDHGPFPSPEDMQAEEEDIPEAWRHRYGQLLQNYAEAHAERALYSDLYNFSPLPYLSINEQGTVVQTNLMGAILLGIRQSECTQYRFIHFLAEASRTEFQNFVEEVLSGKENAECRVIFNGHQRQSPCELQLIGVTDEDGLECRMVMLTREIGE